MGDADLSGKVAFVTGGGTGIGASIAVAYAAAGAATVVIGRRPDPLESVVAQVEAAGGQALAVTADVTDLEATTAAAGRALERFGRLDLVVANAGAAPPLGPVLDMTSRAWEEIVALNLTGVWNTAKATVPAMVDAGGGAFIVIGSGAGRANSGGLGAYSAAKAGASALTRVLAAELRAARVAVNEIVPGPVRTPALSTLSGEDLELEERVRAIGEWLKEPDEVARLALYLASLPVDGTTGQVFSLLGRLV
jgi:NAD(P)-dependent dehydrogenase (short-subunit alcohol dehydrogenase family)